MSFTKTKRMSSSSGSKRKSVEDEKSTPIYQALYGSNIISPQNLKRNSVIPKQSPTKVPVIKPLPPRKIEQVLPRKDDVCANAVDTKITPKKKNQFDRDAIPRKKYFDMLSKPANRPVEKESKPRKRKNTFQGCPPRILQLARPKKAQVLRTWQDFQNVLSPETIDRLNEYLQKELCLEIDEARVYFHQQRRRELKEKRQRLRRKRRLAKQKQRGEQRWMTCMQRYAANQIAKNFENEPLFPVTYKQLCISNKILEMAQETYGIRKPKRKTKRPYEKSVIEVSDQIAFWIDSLMSYLDILQIESESEEEEEEESSSEESEEEVELRSELFSSSESGITVSSEATTNLEDLEGIQQAAGDIGSPYSDMSGEQDETFIVDEDALAILIKILENSDSATLAKEVDPAAFPGVTYADVLQKLKELQKGLVYQTASERARLLDKVITDWATTNDPDKVDEKVRKKIDSASKIISDLLRGGRGGEEMYLKEKDYEVIHRGRMDEIDEEGEGVSAVSLGASDFDDRLEAIADDEQAFSTAEGGSKLGEGDQGEDDAERRAAAAALRALAEEDEGEDGYMAGLGQMGDEDLMGLLGELEESELGEGGEYTDTGEVSDIDTDFEGEGEGVIEPEFIATKVGGLTEAQLAAQKAAAELGEGAEGEGELSPEELAKRAEREGALVGVLDRDGIILGHKPSVTFEHQPDQICCLAMKIYALWLLEVSENANNWGVWLRSIAEDIRQLVQVIRGEVTMPNGEKRVLRKEEWKDFIKKVDDMIVSWRQYNMHFNSLSDKIMEQIKGKKVQCCPKCLQDNYISDLLTAHGLSKELVEAAQTAFYWRDWLNDMMNTTERLTKIAFEEGTTTAEPGPSGMEQIHKTEEYSSSSSEDDLDEESLYDIEEIEIEKPYPPNQGGCSKK